MKHEPSTPNHAEHAQGDHDCLDSDGRSDTVAPVNQSASILGVRLLHVNDKVAVNVTLHHASPADRPDMCENNIRNTNRITASHETQIKRS